jgi:hypothetical protein
MVHPYCDAVSSILLNKVDLSAITRGCAFFFGFSPGMSPEWLLCQNNGLTGETGL